MYKVQDISQTLKTFEGEPIKSGAGENEKTLTLRTVITTQLGSYQGQGVTGDQLIKAYDLGVKIQRAEKEVELDDEQVKFIKDVLGKNPLYTAVVIGQTLKMIENSRVVEEAPKPAESPQSPK